MEVIFHNPRDTLWCVTKLPHLNFIPQWSLLNLKVLRVGFLDFETSRKKFADPSIFQFTLIFSPFNSEEVILF